MPIALRSIRAPVAILTELILVPHPQKKKASAAKAKRARARANVDVEEQLSKQEARLARQVDERRQKDRQNRRRRLRNIGIGVVAAALVVAGGWSVFRPDSELNGVSRPRSLGGGHVAAASYDSPTPTSGAHDARAPSCATYREPLEPALAVHALEHGAVVLWYDADRPELADELEAVTEKWDSHVIVSSNTGLDAPIVAAAWNRLKSYEPGDPEINDFVRTYRQRGPESVPCDT